MSISEALINIKIQRKFIDIKITYLFTRAKISEIERVLYRIFNRSGNPLFLTSSELPVFSTLVVESENSAAKVKTRRYSDKKGSARGTIGLNLPSKFLGQVHPDYARWRRLGTRGETIMAPVGPD